MPVNSTVAAASSNGYLLKSIFSKQTCTIVQIIEW